MQGLYQWQLTGQSAAEIINQLMSSEEAASVDRDHCRELITQCVDEYPALTNVLGRYIDRPIEQLDPVETAILLIGAFELQHRVDVPYRVVINEAVDLCKKFGATDAHKYVNAVLDRASRELRATERAR